MFLWQQHQLHFVINLMTYHFAVQSTWKRYSTADSLSCESRWQGKVAFICWSRLCSVTSNPAFHLQVYRRLNIRIMLVGLEIWTKRDLIKVDPSEGTTLDNFLSWRQSDLLLRVKHDNAQFVTWVPHCRDYRKSCCPPELTQSVSDRGTDFEGDTVGLANKFAMCTPNSGGVNQVGVTPLR